MDKHQYVKVAFEQIRKKNIESPFYIADGCKVTDLEVYLHSLQQAYIHSIDSRLEKLFFDKIEQLKTL